MKKIVVSVLQTDVESLQKVGVPVFKRIGTGIPDNERYFAEIVKIGEHPSIPKTAIRNPVRRKLSPDTKLILTENVPKFVVPNCNLAKGYTAARNCFRPDKSKPITRKKLTLSISKATGLSKGQVSAVISSLLTRYAALDVYGG